MVYYLRTTPQGINIFTHTLLSFLLDYSRIKIIKGNTLIIR